MKKTVLVLSVLLVFGFLVGCSNGSTDSQQGIYDGVGVWLVNQTNETAYDNNNYEGQPTPTALGRITGKIEDLSSSFSVQLKEPFDYGNGQGWWNFKTPETNWTAQSDDYYVYLVPIYWSSGVSGQGNMEWHFYKGKESAQNNSSFCQVFYSIIFSNHFSPPCHITNGIRSAAHSGGSGVPVA